MVPNVRDAFAESLATIVCDRADGCCEVSGRQEPGDACFSNMRNDAYLVMLLADEERVPLRFDEGASCLDRFRDASTCDATLLAESLPKVCPDLFGDIPAGPNPAGASCEHTYECAAPPDGDRACVATSGSGSSCIWFVAAVAGEACATDPVVVRLCPDGMGCRPLADGATPTCEQMRDPVASTLRRTIVAPLRSVM